MIHPRLLAALVRITDQDTATEISKLVTLADRDIEGTAIAGQMFDSPTPGIAFRRAWLETASDAEIEQALGHEIVHACCRPNGAALKAAIGNYTRLKAGVVPEGAREDYNAETDALIEAGLGAGQPYAIMPAWAAKDVFGASAS